MADNDWNEWSRHVLAELERLNDNEKEITRLVSDMRADIKVLYFKSGFIGMVGGMIPVLITIIIQLMR